MFFRPFSEPMREIAWWLRDRLERQTEAETSEPISDNMNRSWLARIARDIEAMALEFAVQQLKYPLFSEEDGDPWTETAFAFLRLNQSLDKAGRETVVIWRRGQLDRLTRSRAAKKARKVWGKDAWCIDMNTGIQLLCRDPVRLLEPHFRDAFSTLVMSATAQPFDFYQDLLGLSEKRICRLNYPSPFPPENSFHAVVADVSTAYRDRDRDRLKTAEQIRHAVLATPGNVAVYFPSFKMMSELRPFLDFEARPILVQESRMSDAERQNMLSEMRQGRGHVLLAVLGGIFSEGVDLPADALKCAVVVGPSLPQANLGRRLLQEWYQEKYNKGFQYAWLVPGLARVGQAAGRVIRGPTDVGTVVLIGKRFLQKGYQSCLPVEWSLMRSRDIYSDLCNFWDIVSNGQISKDS
jgi:DNA excision repair protein ERCC-2